MPLYHQIANVLRSQIGIGELGPGDQIPAESRLAETFGVSPMTIRQALDTLRQEGLVQRRQGLGTFVSERELHDLHVDLAVPLSAVANPIADLEVKVLSLDRVRPPATVRDLLRLSTDETCIQVRRTRGNQDGLVTYATTYIPLQFGADLTEQDLGDSLMVDILERRGLRFAGAHQTIEAALAEPDTAQVLKVPVGSPILLIRRAFELANGEVGYVVFNRHASQMFRYEMRLRRNGDEPRRWGIATDISGTSGSGTVEPAG